MTTHFASKTYDYILLQDVAQVDEIIERLLDVRNGRPGKNVQLSENEIRALCVTAKEIFMSQPNLLELEAPIKICGGLPWDVDPQSWSSGHVKAAGLARLH